MARPTRACINHPYKIGYGNPPVCLACKAGKVPPDQINTKRDLDSLPPVVNPELPTQAVPGSLEKLAVLAARAEMGLPIHHPQDGILRDYQSEQEKLLRNLLVYGGDSNDPTDGEED